MKENRRLRKELEESQKEVEFLKKAAVFFAKEIGQRLIDFSMHTVKSFVLVGSLDDSIFIKCILS